MRANNHTDPARDSSTGANRGVMRKLLWFAALWLGGVGTVGAVAFVLRLWIG